MKGRFDSLSKVPEIIKGSVFLSEIESQNNDY